MDPPLPVADSGLDLALALAVLAASGQLAAGLLAPVLCLGGLGLDGGLRPVSALPERLAAAAHAGLHYAIVPDLQLADASAAPTVEVRAARALSDVVAGLRDGRPLLNAATWPASPLLPAIDLAGLPDAPTRRARRILEIGAAGGHHILTIGHGTGVPLFAHVLARLLPDLDEADGQDVAMLYQQARVPLEQRPALRRPPWQAPHYILSTSEWTGSPGRPGVIALAHAGLLFSDETAELRRPTLAALRAVLDRRIVSVTDDDRTDEYPARIQLWANTRGCPRPAAFCQCPPAVHQSYRQRLAEIRDRIHIQQTLPPLPPFPLAPDGPPPGESSAAVAARVARARETATARWAAEHGPLNAHVSPELLQASLAGLPTGRFAALRDQVASGALSTRGAGHVLRLAWTIADLAGHDQPTTDDLDEAIGLRTDRAPREDQP